MQHGSKLRALRLANRVIELRRAHPRIIHASPSGCTSMQPGPVLRTPDHVAGVCCGIGGSTQHHWNIHALILWRYHQVIDHLPTPRVSQTRASPSACRHGPSHREPARRPARSGVTQRNASRKTVATARRSGSDCWADARRRKQRRRRAAGTTNDVRSRERFPRLVERLALPRRRRSSARGVRQISIARR